MVSEGRLGVNTEVTLRVRRRPDRTVVAGALLPDLERGLDAVRELVGGGIELTLVRLSDAPETQVAMAVGLGKSAAAPLVDRYLALRGIGEEACLMLFGAAGDRSAERVTSHFEPPPRDRSVARAVVRGRDRIGGGGHHRCCREASRTRGNHEPPRPPRPDRSPGGLMFHPDWRTASLSALDDSFDLVVVGGGITGCGILLDAAQRGLRVLLVERGDIASGTSSRSSKLIHGGLRYLKQMQFRITRLACRERDRMLRLSPHLVHPIRSDFAG
jgi:hypothetical protein